MIYTALASSTPYLSPCTTLPIIFTPPTNPGPSRLLASLFPATHVKCPLTPLPITFSSRLSRSSKPKPFTAQPCTFLPNSYHVKCPARMIAAPCPSPELHSHTRSSSSRFFLPSAQLHHVSAQPLTSYTYSSWALVMGC